MIGMRVLSLFGAVFSFVCLLTVLGSSIEPNLSIKFWYLLAYFLFALSLGWNSQRGGLGLLVFLLPLLPTLHIQLLVPFPTLAPPPEINGINLVAGFVLGDISQRFLKQKTLTAADWTLPTILNLVCVFVSISASLAIARNLWQSTSAFSLSGLWFNAFNFRMNAWRDDFFPLNDLLTYGVAAALLSCVIYNLKRSKSPERDVLLPLLWGVIVAAGWGALQNTTGMGLPYSSASGNRFSQALGFASAGFQPDIHAFSAHMLLGAIGAWGCFFVRDKPLSRVLIVTAICMGWIGLIMSKSRGALVLAVFVYCVGLGVLLWRKSKLYFFMTTTALLFAILAIYVAHRWGLSIIPLWLIQYSESLPKLNINNLAALNQSFGYRAEIYHAALRMFSAFPLMGIGQGEFYRMSGFGSFSQSTFLGAINGENAHNYFLQTLTELGLVGCFLFLIALILPILKSGSMLMLRPAIFICSAIALGNIFAHSLLVRENFFLLCCILGLLYAQSKKNQRHSEPHTSYINTWLKFKPKFYYPIAALSCLVLILAAKEIYQSFERFPYTYGLVCHRSLPITSDGWSSGLIELDAPLQARAIQLNLNGVPPDVLKKPLTLELLTVSTNKGQQVKVTQTRTISTPGPQTITLPIDLGAELNHPIQLKIMLSRCFTPRNLGFSTDPRRLGMQIRDIQFIY
jgi:O-antigen ligase